MPSELNAEIYSPPYLFKGPRPTIADAPRVDRVRDAVHGRDAGGRRHRQGQPDPPRLGHALLRHEPAFLSRLVHPGAGALTVTAPTSGNRAPPGHYMLFLVNADGVPSEAKIVKVGEAAGPASAGQHAADALPSWPVAVCSTARFADRSTRPRRQHRRLGLGFRGWGDRVVAGSEPQLHRPRHLYRAADRTGWRWGPRVRFSRQRHGARPRVPDRAHAPAATPMRPSST